MWNQLAQEVNHWWAHRSVEGDSVGKYLDASWSWCAECEIIQRDFLFGCIVVVVCRMWNYSEGFFVNIWVHSRGVQNVKLFRGIFAVKYLDAWSSYVEWNYSVGFLQHPLYLQTSESCLRYLNWRFGFWGENIYLGCKIQARLIDI